MVGTYPVFIAGALLALCAVPSIGSAQVNEFRVETDVFVPDQTKPLQQTLTLFRDGVAYDFSRDEPGQITILDPRRQRIVMLDATREIQTLVDLASLTALMDSARNQASTTGLAVYLEDARSISFDEPSKTVTVGAKVLRYESTLQEPREAAMATQFAQFADASAYLNAWRANSPPPFARIALNAAVAQRDALPEEITRSTFVLDEGRVVGEHVVKCRLHTNWRLSKNDGARIEEIRGMLVNFKVVSHTEFYQPQPKQVAGRTDAGLK